MNQKAVFFIFLFSLLTACGDGLKVESLSKEIESNSEKLTSVEMESQSELQDIDQEIINLEQVHFDNFKDPKNSLFTLIKIKSSLGDKLKNIADKITAFKSKLNELKTKIQNYIAILDPIDPNQKLIIDRLNKLLDRISQIESSLDSIIQLLKDKLKIIDQIFDQLISKLDPTNPAHMVLRMVIEAIRELIKNRLVI